MATFTTYLQLEKPSTSELLDVLKINSNWDKVDAAYGTLNANMTPSYSTLTLATGVTGTLYLMKMGKIRILTGYVDPGQSTTGLTIATLDSADRPPVNISGSFSGYGVTQTGEVSIISSSGNVQLAINGAPANTVKINMVWGVG